MEEEESTPRAEYPKEIANIAAADNGYIFRIGCQYFVCEGNADKAGGVLTRYLALDASVALEYSSKFDRQHMLSANEIGDDGPAAESKSTVVRAPVFNALHSRQPDVAIFNVVNGTVTLDYHKGTATVKQSFFPIDRPDKDERKE